MTMDSKTEESVKQEIFEEISKHIQWDQWQVFGRELGLSDKELKKLSKHLGINEKKLESVIMKILKKWENKENPVIHQLISQLDRVLRTINQSELADNVSKNLSRFRSQNFTETKQNKQGISDRQLIEIQKEIKQKQQNSFKHLQLPGSLWLNKLWLPLEELFMEFMMTTKNQRGEEQEKWIKIEEFFDELDGKNPERILIEGHPGYGKTTLIAKLLFDWSIGKRFINDKYELVFLIPLRNYDGNVEKHLLQQCEGIEANDKLKMKAIKRIEERVLLLLDGLDECNENIKGTLFPLLQGDEFPMMTVIVTCRTGFIHLEKETDDGFFPMKINGFKKYIMWNRRFHIKGISPEERSNFLKKYCKKDYSQIESKLTNYNTRISDIYECPLFLILLAVFAEEKNITVIGTKTEFYREVLTFVVKRCLVREKFMTNETRFIVFDMKSVDQFNYRKLLLSFGRLCLKKVKNQSLLFQDDELIECSGGDNMISKLGILSKQILFFNNEKKEHYEPIHRSFVEFLAAFYLSTLTDSELDEEIKELLLKFNIFPKEDQFLYPFLGGLLQDNAFKLFNAFSHYKSLISVFNDKYLSLYNIEGILTEIPQTYRNLEYLENLPLGNWENIQYKESQFAWFLKLINNPETLAELSFILPKHNFIFNSLPENIKVNRILLDVNDSDDKRDEFKWCEKQIQCSNLLYYSKTISENFPFILENMRTIRAEKIWLKLNFDFNWGLAEELKKKLIFKEKEKFNFLCNEINRNNYLCCLNFYFLSLDRITPILFQLLTPNIQDLIKSNKILYGLNILFDFGKINYFTKKAWKSFINIVSISHLKSIGIDNYSSFDPLQFPLQLFIEGKQWKFIGLRGKFTTPDISNLTSFSVEYIHFDSRKVCDKNYIPKLLLKSKNIKRLSCECSVISELGCCNDEVSEWEGFETIERLDLMGEMNIKLSLIETISVFKNLREVCFKFIDYDLIVDFLSVQPSLKKVSIICDVSFLEVLKKLMLLKFQKGRKINLEEFKIGGFFAEDLSNDFAKCLEKCFHEKIFFKFSFSNSRVRALKKFLKYFISKNEFEIHTTTNEEPCYNEIFSSTIDEFPELTYSISIRLK